MSFFPSQQFPHEIQSEHDLYDHNFFMGPNRITHLRCPGFLPRQNTLFYIQSGGLPLLWSKDDFALFC
jgi:hypothetical protein